jgi:hypothetical protein
VRGFALAKLMRVGKPGDAPLANAVSKRSPGFLVTALVKDLVFQVLFLPTPAHNINSNCQYYK